MNEEPLPDQLRLRGSVVAASDEFFGAKENLINPSEPVFVPEQYDARGQVSPGQLRSAGIARAYALADIEPDLTRCLEQPGPLLEELAGHIARDWLAPLRRHGPGPPGRRYDMVASPTS